jgi:hypothetical protein
VIEFIVMTSLVNLSLGFALAIYLGRAKVPSANFAWPRLRRAAPAPIESPVVADSDAANRRSDHRDAEWPAHGVADEGVAAPPADRTRTPDSLPAEAEATPGEPPMETDLLAGIEEFRSQLAHMKDEAGLSLADVSAGAP